MEKAMKKYRMNAKGRVDRVLFGRVSIVLKEDKSFEDDSE